MPRLNALTRAVDAPVGTVVLLPGFADRPERFLARVDQLDPDERWTFVVLEPRLQGDRGPYWYHVDENGPVAEELDAAVTAVRDELAALIADGIASPDTVVLAGFSQGGALALATTIDPDGGPMPAAVAVISGYLAQRDEASIDLRRTADRTVLVVHGEDDDVVETLRGRSAAKALQRADARVTWAATDGGHRFDGALLVPVREWLDALARGERPIAPI